MKKLSIIAFLLFIGLFSSSCSSSNDCYTCTLNITSVDVCESNYEELAASNNATVGSLEEYLELIRPTGFECVLIE